MISDYISCKLQLEISDDFVVKTLTALNKERITFPGKADKSSEYILNKVQCL